MDVACRHFYPKYKSVFVAGGVRLISKLPLVLSLDEHPGIRIGSRNRPVGRSSGFVFIIVIFFDRFLPQLLPLRVDLLPKLFIIDLCILFHLLLLVFLLIGRCFDMSSIDEHRRRVYHTVIQGFA